MDVLLIGQLVNLFISGNYGVLIQINQLTNQPINYFQLNNSPILFL